MDCFSNRLANLFSALTHDGSSRVSSDVYRKVCQFTKKKKEMHPIELGGTSSCRKTITQNTSPAQQRSLKEERVEGFKQAESMTRP